MRAMSVCFVGHRSSAKVPPCLSEHVAHHPRGELARCWCSGGSGDSSRSASGRSAGCRSSHARTAAAAARRCLAASASAGTRRTRSCRARRRRARGGSAATSASRCGRQLAISSGVGLLSGGAQRTAAAMNASRSVEAVVGSRDVGMFAKPVTMERRHQEIARAADAVAGEDPAGAVRAVRGRRQPDDEQPRAGSPNPGTGRAQYVSCAEGASFLDADPLAVLAQTRAALAGDNRVATR